MTCPHDSKGDSMITAIFRVKRTANGLTVQAEFTGHGPRGRKHVQTKRFRDAYGSASSKLQDWIDDWKKCCAAVGIHAQYSIEVTQ
tara:strand:- start:6 stop:263 length:258 start_codon:yes stop_codon:yes gene_type:complete